LVDTFKKKSNIVDIELQRHALKIFINARIGTLNDAKGVAKDVSKIGHYGNGDYEIKVTDDRLQ
jgi:predicted transport protein